MYLLRKGLCTYFKEVDKKGDIVSTGSSLSAQLFSSKEVAIKFKLMLESDYNLIYNIVRL